MSGRLMIYGATGYTGKLVAKAAKARGLNPLLAGRNQARLKAVADPLGFEYRSFSLDNPAALDAALAEVQAVLHIAGPFSQTSRPMLDACLRTKRHYMDITGEIAVLEACAARDGEARQAGIAVIPGVGFDVVPSDCLAAHMKARLPDATELTLAIGGLEKVSRGTAKSSLESVGDPVRIRRGGRILTQWPPERRDFDFGNGPRPAIAIGWGDVSTAYYSTGIENITVYFEASRQLESVAKLGPTARWLLSRKPVQSLLKRAVDFLPEGPSDDDRATSFGTLVGEAVNAHGQKVITRLTTPDGYTLTGQTSLEIAQRLLSGNAEPGFQTPSRAFGADFILGIEGCVRQDVQ